MKGKGKVYPTQQFKIILLELNLHNIVHSILSFMHYLVHLYWDPISGKKNKKKKNTYVS